MAFILEIPICMGRAYRNLHRTPQRTFLWFWDTWCNPSTQKVEAGRPGVYDQLWVHNKSEANLWYIRSCLKKLFTAPPTHHQNQTRKNLMFVIAKLLDVYQFQHFTKLLQNFYYFFLELMYYQRTDFVFETGFYYVALPGPQIAMHTRLAHTDLPISAF